MSQVRREGTWSRSLLRWWGGQGKTVRQILSFLTVLASITTFAGLLINPDISGLLLNFGSGIAGSLVTFVLIDRILGNRETLDSESKAHAQLKLDLAGRFGSHIRDVAVAAAEELARHNWLCDGSLRGLGVSGADLSCANLWRADINEGDLQDANLEKVNLSFANLENACLVNSNLSGAAIRFANLAGADLTEANLWEADLFSAQLKNATLLDTNLKSANLNKTDLSGANLEGADLSKASLQDAVISSDQLATAAALRLAVMPDGKRYNGYLRLKKDLYLAQLRGVDLSDPAALARWYKVSPDEYAILPEFF